MKNALNPIKEFRKPLNKAFKKLEKEGIKATIYYYKRGECSCCFGPGEGNEFTVEGNYAPNQGCHGAPYEEHGYRITYVQDQKKAIKFAEAVTEALEGTGWTLTWTGNVNATMSIKKLYVPNKE